MRWKRHLEPLPRAGTWQEMARAIISQSLAFRDGSVLSARSAINSVPNAIGSSEGFLKTCLQYDNGVELKTILRGGGTDEDLRRAIGQALAEKPKGHNFEKKTEFTDREHRGMSQIGG